MNNYKIAILMATYNGELYLQEQLKSIKNQTLTNWDLWVSDDDSTDNTLSILEEFKKEVSTNNKVYIVRGPKKGSNSNFWSMVLNKDIKADYFAFADQDDIWYEDKLEKGLSSILEKNIPLSLYCARTEIVNKEGEFQFYSPLFKLKPSFLNALVQSLAGGNTMIFSNHLREYLMFIGLDNQIIAHDWLIYQIACGVGSEIIYDPIPKVKYRQHDKNLIGSNIGFFSRMNRIYKLLNGSFKNWNDCNLKILYILYDQFTDESKKHVKYFEKMRSNYFFKLKNLFNVRIYRQTFLGNIALIISIYINRL